MASVLVGIFDSKADADTARTKLVDAGFSPSAARMHPDESTTTGSTATSTSATAAPEQEGAISKFFHSIFGSDDDTADSYGGTYREAFRRGSYALTVNVDSDTDVDRAQDILNAAGAVDIDERSNQWRSEGWNDATASTSASTLAAGTSGAASAATMTSNLSEGDTRTLPMIEEELKVGKRTVARGGVRVYSRMLEVPVEESVMLREEHASVQRRVVDRPATAADLSAFESGTIEVRESAEEAVVSKDARVVGEVEVGKHVTQREETVRDTVRKTEVEVEQLDTVTTTGTATTTGVTGTPGSTRPL